MSCKGKIIEQPCKECSGTGHVRKKKTLEINIPAGIANEQMLKVSGQGNAGTNGGPAGDLLLVVNVRLILFSHEREMTFGAKFR